MLKVIGLAFSSAGKKEGNLKFYIMIKEGTLIEFESGRQYEVIKVFSQNLVDLRASQPQFEWMPDYFPIYYSIELKDYKIIN